MYKCNIIINKCSMNNIEVKIQERSRFIKAYSLPRTLDAERVVIHAYARALYNTSIARKLINWGYPGGIRNSIDLHRA